MPNLSELHADPQKMLAWLTYDGNPPTVFVKGEPKSVTDEFALTFWWDEYRKALDEAWQRRNPHRYISHDNFLGECARAMGFKTGKVKEKIAAAREYVRSLSISAPTSINTLVTVLAAVSVIAPNATRDYDIFLEPCPNCGQGIDCVLSVCPHCNCDVDKCAAQAHK